VAENISGRAVWLSPGTYSLSGNRACGGGVDLFVALAAEMSW